MAAAGREEGYKAFERNVKINLNAVVNTEGADTADSMADIRFYFVSSQHFGLASEEMLVLGVIYLSIACCDDEDNAVIMQLKGKGFGNARRLTACCLCCQLYSSAGGCKLYDTIICIKLFQVCTNLFYRHDKSLPLKMLTENYQLKNHSSHPALQHGSPPACLHRRPLPGTG